MSWLPRFSFPEEYFSPQAGLKAIFEALQRLGDGLLGIKKEIFESKKQILEAVQETTNRTSQEYLSFKRIIKVEEIIMNSQRVVLDELERCNYTKETSEVIRTRQEQWRKRYLVSYMAAHQ